MAPSSGPRLREGRWTNDPGGAVRDKTTWVEVRREEVDIEKTEDGGYYGVNLTTGELYEGEQLRSLFELFILAGQAGESRQKRARARKREEEERNKANYKKRRRRRYERARETMEDELSGCYERRLEAQKAVERSEKKQVSIHKWAQGKIARDEIFYA